MYVICYLYLSQYSSSWNQFITQDLKDQFHLSLEPRAPKSALFVEDLDLLLTHHWILDTEVFPHERMRLQLAMILIIAGATSTRPGALLQLRYGDIEFALFPSSDGARPHLTMTVRLKETKQRGGKRTPTAFGFHEEIKLIHCPVVGIMALALADDAFVSVKGLEQVYKLRVPANKDRIRLALKNSELDRPIFRDMGLRSDERKPYEYGQARSALARLGRSCGYEQQLMFYDLRRASGRLLTRTVSPEERNQIMGHSGGTSTVYRQYYMPEFVDRDVQSISFGSTAQDDLVRAIGRIPRNGAAPTKLTREQKDSINDHPEVRSAVAARDQVTAKFRKSFCTIKRARQDGTAEAAALLRQHSVAERRVHSVRNYRRNECLKRSIKEFHTSADDVEVRQQNRTVEQQRTPAQFSPLLHDLKERRQVVNILHQCADPNKVADLDGLRIRLVDRLAALAQMKDTPHIFRKRRHDTDPDPVPRPTKKAKTSSAANDPVESYQSTFRLQQPKDMGCPFCRQEATYGPRRRGHNFARIDSLRRHIFEQHFTDKGCIKPDRRHPQDQGTNRFTCPYAGCSASLLTAGDFACHAQGLHGIGPFPRKSVPGSEQGWRWVSQFDGK